MKPSKKKSPPPRRRSGNSTSAKKISSSTMKGCDTNANKNGHSTVPMIMASTNKKSSSRKSSSSSSRRSRNNNNASTNELPKGSSTMATATTKKRKRSSSTNNNKEQKTNRMMENIIAEENETRHNNNGGSIGIGGIGGLSRSRGEDRFSRGQVVKTKKKANKDRDRGGFPTEIGLPSEIIIENTTANTIGGQDEELGGGWFDEQSKKKSSASEKENKSIGNQADEAAGYPKIKSSSKQSGTTGMQSTNESVQSCEAMMSEVASNRTSKSNGKKKGGSFNEKQSNVSNQNNGQSTRTTRKVETEQGAKQGTEALQPLAPKEQITHESRNETTPQKVAFDVTKASRTDSAKKRLSNSSTNRVMMENTIPVCNHLLTNTLSNNTKTPKNNDQKRDNAQQNGGTTDDDANNSQLSPPTAINNDDWMDQMSATAKQMEQLANVARVKFNQQRQYYESLLRQQKLMGQQQQQQQHNNHNRTIQGEQCKENENEQLRHELKVQREMNAQKDVQIASMKEEIKNLKLDLDMARNEREYKW